MSTLPYLPPADDFPLPESQTLSGNVELAATQIEIARWAISIGDNQWRDCAMRYLQCYAKAAFRQWADERLREMHVEKSGGAA